MVGKHISSDGAGSIILASLNKLEENERMATLRACALVCRAFSHFTRPFFFHQADVGFNEGFYCEKRLLSLLDMVDLKPDLLRHIHDLRLDLQSTPPGPLMPHRSPEDLTRCTNFLLDIPNLESISLLYSDTTDHREDYLSTSEVTKLCERVMETYTGSKSRLRSLHAKKIRKLPFSSIYGCAVLHTLSLDRCEWPELKIPVPQLRTLKLRKICDPIRFASLLYLPNLKNLIMDEAEFEDVNRLNVTQESRDTCQLLPRASFALETLTINTYTGSDELTKLATHLQHYAQNHDEVPFPHLESLSLRVSIYGLPMPNLRTLPSLRFLNLQGQRFNLDSTLLFESIAPDNQLSHLNVRFHTPDLAPHPEEEGFPESFFVGGIRPEAQSTLFWSNLPKFIRNCIKFPRLRKLTLEIPYYPRHRRDKGREELTSQNHLNDSGTVEMNVADRWMTLEDRAIVERLTGLHKAIVKTPIPADCILSDCKMRVDKISNYLRHATIMFQKPK